MASDKLPKIPGLGGIPSVIVLYYHRYGLPGEVLSTRESQSTKDSTTYISILFKGCKFRHRWCDNLTKANQFSKIRQEDWLMDELPL